MGQSATHICKPAARRGTHKLLGLGLILFALTLALALPAAASASSRSVMWGPHDSGQEDNLISFGIPFTGAASGGASGGAYGEATGADVTILAAISRASFPPPVVESFSPAYGEVGHMVEIWMTGWEAGVTAVSFNGTPAEFEPITWVAEDAHIDARVPAGATSGPIAVTTSEGTGVSTGDFAVVAAPTITGFTPTSGVGGTKVTLTGTNFYDVAEVTFNGHWAAHGVVSSTEIIAIVPVREEDFFSGPIAVRNLVGTGVSAESFTYTPRPAITGFTPTWGPVGTKVTLTGTAFGDARAVVFGYGINNARAVFTRDSETQITATVPSNAKSGPIAVTTPGGTGWSATNFTFIQPPSVTVFTPTSGPVGTSVTLTGSKFNGVTKVAFNGTETTTFTVDSETQITASVPVGATSGPIAVTARGGTATSATSFAVIPPPNVESFSPTSGPPGTTVTLTGSSFGGASSVTFDGASAVFNVNSATQIIATVPSNATSGPIAVTTVAGTGTSVGRFTVAGTPVPPTITGFTPTSGPVGTAVTVTGSGFTGATSVKFNGTSATYTVNSATKITAAVPAGATTGTIAITALGGSTKSATSFTVTAPPVFTPTVTLKLTGLRRGAIRLGRSVTAKGIVTPSGLAGSKVTLTVQKKKGTRWVKVKAVTRTISSTMAYSWKYKPAKRGAYRVQAKIAKTAAHTAAKTPWRKFKVR